MTPTTYKLYIRHFKNYKDATYPQRKYSLVEVCRLRLGLKQSITTRVEKEKSQRQTVKENKNFAGGKG